MSPALNKVQTRTTELSGCPVLCRNDFDVLSHIHGTHSIRIPWRKSIVPMGPVVAIDLFSLTTNFTIDKHVADEFSSLDFWQSLCILLLIKACAFLPVQTLFLHKQQAMATKETAGVIGILLWGRSRKWMWQDQRHVVFWRNLNYKAVPLGEAPRLRYEMVNKRFMNGWMNKCNKRNIVWKKDDFCTNHCHLIPGKGKTSFSPSAIVLFLIKWKGKIQSGPICIRWTILSHANYKRRVTGCSRIWK